MKRTPAGFTLVELMAVVAVIAVLAGLTIGTAGYIKTKMTCSTVKADLGKIALALEVYRADWGYYPRTLPARISADGATQSTNNWLLYRAMQGGSGGKVYLTFRPEQVQTNIRFRVVNVFDPWKVPYQYYCSPATSTAVTNGNTCGQCGVAWGGQLNPATFDLYSYGPDGMTYVPGAIGGNNSTGFWPSSAGWNLSASAIDDLHH